MMSAFQNEDDHWDDHVDNEIANCLNLNKSKSFFLFAGAGSGKTGSLVKALNHIRENYYQELQFNGQKVAIITYTNAACDEIGRRIDYDPLFFVSTIHSFMWGLIKEFNIDIKRWMITKLTNEISELELKLGKGKIGDKTFFDRKKKLEVKRNRLQSIMHAKRFAYNPNGLNQEKASLSHTEVIGIGAYFLTNKKLMQKVLVKKYPVLLIDESQDTNKELIDAILAVERNTSDSFSLGLFGDTMQRIYSDGKVDIGTSLPDNWAKPVKSMNHRCSQRVVKLINKIRSTIDQQEQRYRTDKDEGYARLFIFPTTVDKENAEKLVLERMREITGDHQWYGTNSNFTTLILEHHMAARRLGFFELFKPLYEVDKLKTGLLDGSLSGMSFFTELILPIVLANNDSNKLAITKIVRKYSPLLRIQKGEIAPVEQIKKTQISIKKLLSLWDSDKDPRCIDVLQCVAQLNLFDIPDSLYPYVTRDITNQSSKDVENHNEDGKNKEIQAWEESLEAPFSQIVKYESYIFGKSKFMTHQGVKGLEFPRVMVIIDDSEARGFLFSYEKLFGVKEKSKTDIENEKTGKDTSIDRTKRLFYVTCSRAEESLAIVAYTERSEAVKEHVIKEGWFEEYEVETIE